MWQNPHVLILDEQSVGGGAARGVARRGQVAGSRAKLLGESLSCQPRKKTARSRSRLEAWDQHRRDCDVKRGKQGDPLQPGNTHVEGRASLVTAVSTPSLPATRRSTS